MRADERLLVESVAEDLLAKLGYETEGKVRTISSVEEFRWKTHHLVPWVFQKLNTRDKLPGTAWLMLRAKLRCAWKLTALQRTRFSGEHGEGRTST